MRISQTLQLWLAWTASLLAVLVMVYVLTAPPIILAHYNRTGDGGIPSFYDPLMDVAFSDFGAPVMWYFNSVWHAELSAIGQEPELHWYVILCDGIVCLGFAAVIGLPLFRLIYRRSHAA
jgi:hypothetical protein